MGIGSQHIEKYEERMGDKEWLAKIASVTDPKEACRLLAENENYLGFDPYYRDIREALINMCERCGGEIQHEE